MRADRGEALRQARHLDGQRKGALVGVAIDAAVQHGQALTITAIARRAGVGRKFIYDHPDLRAEIELKAAQATHHQANDIIATARVTGASLRADLENSRAENRRLNKQLRALESRLSHAEGARLITGDLLPEDIVNELADQQLARRVRELEQQLFDTKDELRRTVEELEAARRINRELMQHANHLPDDGSGRTSRERPTTTRRTPRAGP